jgi:hypothetical protein
MMASSALTYTVRAAQTLRVLLPIAISIVAGLLLVLKYSRSSSSRFTLESFAPRSSQAKVLLSGPPIPGCPPAGSPMLQPSAPHTGHHKVILTWNPSAPSPHPEDNPVGYCLYRSPTKGAALKNATCSNCEQINLVPVVGTACVDDLVQDGATYFYVATAINVNKIRSVSSNEIIVPIPASPKVSSASMPTSYPLCRASASPQ